jgi:hypothetical protein
MTDKVFSQEMRTAMKSDAKKIIFLDIPKQGIHSCPNCGGVGFMYLFIATGGPFDNSSTKPGDISTYFDQKWWTGRHYAFECPVCHAESYKPPVIEPPVIEQIDFTLNSSDYTNT